MLQQQDLLALLCLPPVHFCHLCRCGGLFESLVLPHSNESREAQRDAALLTDKAQSSSVNWGQSQICSGGKERRQRDKVSFSCDEFCGLYKICLLRKCSSQDWIGSNKRTRNDQAAIDHWEHTSITKLYPPCPYNLPPGSWRVGSPWRTFAGRKR